MFQESENFETEGNPFMWVMLPIALVLLWIFNFWDYLTRSRSKPQVTIYKTQSFTKKHQPKEQNGRTNKANRK